MDTKIINEINKLKCSTVDNIKEVSKSKVPFLSTLNLSRRTKYFYCGKYYKSPTINSMIFLVQDLPYTHYSTDKKDYTFKKTVQEAVKDHDIFPFLLFLDKKFIKWSDIILVRDTHYSYLIIMNFYKIDCDVNTLLIPETNIEYKENDKNPSRYTFLFDSYGLYNYGPKKDFLYTSINIMDDDLLYVNQEMPCNIRFHIPVQQKVELDHILTFKNGLLMDNDIKEYGLNVFNIKDKDDKNCFYYSFIYKYSSKLLDNEVTIANKDVAIKDLIDGKSNSLLDSLEERFNFKFDLSKDNISNMNNALRYIMDYNASLISDIYKEKSRIISKFYTGKELLSSVNNSDGYLHLSRKIKDCINAYIIVFKNGYLYEYYQNGKYKDKDFLLKIIDVDPNDKFEIMYILDIDNNIYNLRMYSAGEDIIKIDPDINIDNMILMSPTPYNHNFENLERNDEILYTVDYEYERIDNENIKLILKNSFYYDKLLYMGSKKQFRYYCKYNTSDEETYEFILPDTFKMCNNFDSYMIFINGVFICKEDYDITIFNTEDPFYNMQVYMNKPINKNDKVEVIYIGHKFKEIYNEKDIKNSNILIDVSKMKYPFNKDNYIIFNNGRKLLPEELINIDSHRFSISTPYVFSNNISIIQYINEEEVLTSLFENNSDLLNSICNKLSQEDLSRYYSNNSVSIVTVPDDGEILNDRNERILRIIKDYWMKSYINNGDEMPISIYEHGNIIDTGNV